jgi:type IV pilus assembly protein PilC
MPKFAYEAIAAGGQREKGSMEAANSVAVGHSLKERGLIPVSIQSESGMRKDIFAGFRRVKLKEKLVFIQDLEVMLRSGIPLSRSLQVLSSQTENPAFTEVLRDISKNVENGLSLHESLAKHPKVFSEIFVSMIGVGEMSGSLDQSLGYLKIQLERESELNSRVKGAMVYPSVVMGVMILAAIMMATFVLPKLTSIFKDFNASLPLATKVIIFISDTLAAHSLVVFPVVIVLGVLFFRLLKTSIVKKWMMFAALRLPGVGTLVQEISLARFSRIAASLLKSGISVVETLQVAGEAMPNPYYKQAILDSSAAVKLGRPMTESLAKYQRLFPFLFTQMLSVGEETGAVEVIFEQMASHFEASVDATLKNLSSIIEPLLLVVIGGAVGVVAYALIIPIYNIGSQID